MSNEAIVLEQGQIWEWVNRYNEKRQVEILSLLAPICIKYLKWKSEETIWGESDLKAYLQLRRACLVSPPAAQLASVTAERDALKATVDRLESDAGRFELEADSACKDAWRLEKEVERLKEWRDSVSGAIKQIPEFATGEWEGDKEGWGYHFEVVRWITRDHASVKAEVERYQRWKEIIERAPSGKAQEVGIARFLQSEQIKPITDAWKEKVAELESALAAHESNRAATQELIDVLITQAVLPPTVTVDNLVDHVNGLARSWSWLKAENRRLTDAAEKVKGAIYRLLREKAEGAKAEGRSSRADAFNDAAIAVGFLSVSALKASPEPTRQNSETPSEQ